MGALVAETSIEWTDRTWNPVRGCSRVSEGCRNCYAERMAARFSGTRPGESPWRGGTLPDDPFFGFAEMTKAGPRWTGRVELIPGKLDEPLRWRKPQRVFVNSMSDLFHESLDFHDIAAVYGVMSSASHHTFQILTKRPARRREFFRWMCALSGDDLTAGDSGVKTMATDPVFGAEMAAGNRGVRFGARSPDNINRAWPLPNVWEGVSVEDQKTKDERVPLLLGTPAAKRFVSYEPALGPVDFTGWLYSCDGDCSQPAHEVTPTLSWVIVGGESGPGARPFDVAWARATVAQCKAAGVACFYKQGGAANHCAHDAKGGHFECFPEDLRVREFPA